MTMRATITCCSLVIKAPVIKALVIETGAEAAPVAVAVVQRPDEEHEIDDQQPGVHPAVSRLDVTAVALHLFVVGLRRRAVLLAHRHAPPCARPGTLFRRAACWERDCTDVKISVVAVRVKK